MARSVLPCMSHAGIRRSALATWFLLAALANAGCALTAQYDAATVQEILVVAKRVDMFYGALLDTKEDSRAYSGYGPAYIAIEADLRSLWLRNKARPLNDESTTIARDTLDFWIKYKDAHKRDNAYPDKHAEAHRRRFERQFVSAVTAETAKNTDDGDITP